MSLIRFGDGGCGKVRRYLDSYIDNELMVETNHEVLDHLEDCCRCSHELDARTTLKARLRQAGAHTAVPPDLELRIRKALHAYDAERGTAERRRYWFMSLAAIVLLSLGTWKVLNRNTVPEQLANIGLLDHIHCATQRDYSGPPPDLERMQSDMGSEFKDLIPVVRREVPADYTLEQAHRCSYKQRRYTHMIFRNGSRLLSLIITRKRPGESFAGSGAIPVMEASGVPVYEMELDKFATAGTETGDELVFVISNLTPGQNLRMAASITPGVRDFLHRSPKAAAGESVLRPTPATALSYFRKLTTAVFSEATPPYVRATL